jgi:DNA-binding PadR family transcriptional regulator
VSLKIPKDLDILRFLQEPHNRYQVSKHFGNHYPSIIVRTNKLQRMGLIFVIRQEQGHGPEPVKFYVITAKGQAMLRGYEEGESI